MRHLLGYNRREVRRKSIDVSDTHIAYIFGIENKQCMKQDAEADNLRLFRLFYDPEDGRERFF
jgi:hypothetical protein